MQIRQEGLLDFVGREDARFSIPVFQRVYSWSARQCEELWDDVMRAGAPGGGGHFMGMILYSIDAQSWSGGEQLEVLDEAPGGLLGHVASPDESEERVAVHFGQGELPTVLP